MAFATDPPYCVAYSADYKTNDPTEMTARHIHNHPYAMITDNMIVRRLLSLPNWGLTVRKKTEGGHLLIPRGMQFGPALFPEKVVPCTTTRVHLSIQPCGRRLHFRLLGPFEPWIAIFPSFSGGFRIVYCQGSGKVEGVGGFESSQCTGVSATLFHHLYLPVGARVVSAALGAPPPGFEAHGIEKSLMTRSG